MLSSKFSSGGWRRAGLLPQRSLRGLRNRAAALVGPRGWCRLQLLDSAGSALAVLRALAAARRMPVADILAAARWTS